MAADPGPVDPRGEAGRAGPAQRRDVGGTTPQERNLFDLKPLRSYGSEASGDHAVVLVPKFRSGLLARWMSRLGRPHFRVRLDAEGSFVWAQCDGATPVIQIAERLHQRVGGDAAALRDRVARFVEKLVRDGLVTLDHPGETS